MPYHILKYHICVEYTSIAYSFISLLILVPYFFYFFFQCPPLLPLYFLFPRFSAGPITAMPLSNPSALVIGPKHHPTPFS